MLYNFNLTKILFCMGLMTWIKVEILVLLNRPTSEKTAGIPRQIQDSYRKQLRFFRKICKMEQHYADPESEHPLC